MADTSTPNLSQNSTFDRRELYKSVRFQQGKPVLDTELNDAQDMTIEELLSKARLDQRFSGIETSPFEWAVMPTNVNPLDQENNDNFSVTIGRLPTRAGILDTENLFTANDGDFTIPYDPFLFKQVGGLETVDNANYVFKGKVSVVDQVNNTSIFQDLSKNLQSHHLLTEQSTTYSFGQAPNTKSLTVKTGACRVVFTSALNPANVGDAYEIVNAGGNQIEVNALPASISVGDQYVILPPNMLTANRSAWDTAVNSETIIGKEANPLQLIFVNTWEEDISSDEDPNIENGNIGTETTHRTQLRWTVRIANVFGDAIYGLAASLSDSGEHATADDARALLENLITTQEFSIGSNRDSEWNIGANGFTQQTLLLSTGDLDLDTSEDNALSDRPQSILGVQKVSSPVLRKMGDDGLLNFDILKAVLGLHTTQGSSVAYDRYSSDQLILLVSSAPSKRLHQEFLIGGARATDLPNFADGAAPAANSDTLSARFWPNLDDIHNGVLNVADNADATIPRFWNKSSLTANSNGYYTHVTGSDLFSVQPSVYVAPPRIFLKSSDATAEIMRARQAFYGATPYRAMDQLRSVYAPLVLDRLSIAEGETLRQVLFNSLDGRLDAYDNAILSIIGQAGITQLRATGNNPATQVGTIFRVTPCTNLLLQDTNAIGNASSGTTYRQQDSASTSTSYIHPTMYGDDVRTFGTIDFEDPLYSANAGWNAQVRGSELTGKAQLSQQNSSYRIREQLNGSNTISYNDEDLGWSRSKSANEQRLWHEGIAQAKAFKDSFNLRKLAIKTSAHAEADLFTIDQPLWFQAFSDNATTLAFLRSTTVEPAGGPSHFAEALYTAFDNLKFGATSVLASSRSAIRSQRADVHVKGPMGISSAAGTSYAPPITENGISAISKALGHKATNSTLLPFLNNISGSTSISRLDQGSSSNLDDVHGSRYYDDFETSSAKMNEPLKGAWGRRELSLLTLIGLADNAAQAGSGKEEYFMPSTSLDTNRATALRLRYHVGDFYPGELDINGVPSNLLVDSLNLFVRIEPLSFTHWMTMPKHQHSILEGSMDLSEAIATLLDISNGRGIPDHLYSLTSSYASETDASDFLFIDSNEGNVVPRSVLDLESFALSKNEPRLVRNDQTLTLTQAHTRYYNSEIAVAFRELSLELFSVPNNGQGINGTDLIFRVLAGSEIDITAVVPVGNNGMFVNNYFQSIGIEANNGQYDLLTKWISNDEWKTLYDRWASRRNRPLSAEVLSDPSLTETGLKDFYLDVANHLKTVLSSFLFNSSRVSKDLDGLIDSGSLRSETLYEAIADLMAPNSPATSGLATTTPIISDWLSKLSPVALERMYPALAAVRNHTNGKPDPLPVVSALSLKTLTELIQSQVDQDGDLKDDSGNNINLGDFFRDLLEENRVTVGSVDPVAVCIPSNAQPYVHWWHPNMDALQAPGGEDGFWLSTSETVSQNSGDINVKYQAYPEWSRESMIYTGIVPMSDRLTSRARGIMSNHLGITNWLTGAGFNESALTETNAGTDDSGVQINALRLFNGVTGLFPGADDVDGSVPAVESFYKTAYDYNIVLGRINPHAEGFPIDDNSNADPEGDSFNYTPYFSHSTGVLGFGGLNLPNSVGFGDGLNYEVNNYTGSLPAQRYNSWANWFPYLPSVTHQHGDAYNNAEITSRRNGTNTVKDRLIRTVFHQATRPVYLPASMSVIDNVNTGFAHTQSTVFTPGIEGYDASSRNQDNQYAYNAGYNPLISNPKLQVTDNDDSRDAYYDVRGLPYDANTLRVLQALNTARIDGFSGRTEVQDNNFSEIIPDSLPHTEPFSGAALRSGLKTDTLAWINLYVKTYSRTYGHDSIHPYSYLDDANDRPAWHIDFADSRGIVSGKGPDKDVDTLMMGDLGTNVFVSRRSVFLDPLCLGVGATRQDGTLVHDSDNDLLREDNLVFRDIFDMCSYEREAKRILMLQGGSTQLNVGLLYTSAMWSKLGMQTKLMLNSSIRVLHNRPGGAVATGGAALNYGGLSSPTKSLTEMFLAVDAETNQLKRLPRLDLSSPSNKPYIHLESMIDTGDISNLGGSATHPNFKWMKPLKRMVSTNLSGSANSMGDQFRTADGLQLQPTNDINNVKEYWIKGENALVQSGSTTEVGSQRSLIPSHMGDTFASDPFDTLWDQGAGITEVHAPVANSAQNSGVEYELLSSLGRMHDQATKLRLRSKLGNSNTYLQESIVTPNELTLPGDHEIVFVLYTGNHGQSFAEDLSEGINPPVAGCHIKASIEINRPSERTDSPHIGDHGSERALHYGVQTPASLLPFSPAIADGIKIAPQGLMTFSVAGGRPTLDNTVYDEDGNEV